MSVLRSSNPHAGVNNSTKITDASSPLDHLLQSAAILIVDNDPQSLSMLRQALTPRCAVLKVASSAEEAEALRLRLHFDVLLIDVHLPGLSGLEWLRLLREAGVRTRAIYMANHADVKMVIDALRIGSDDFVIKPFATDQMLTAIHKCLSQYQVKRETSLQRLQLEQVKKERNVIGQDPVFIEALALAQQVATSHSSVLIQGEVGTGKALVARTMHSLSKRKGGFVSVNCKMPCLDQLESELFGQVNGGSATTHSRPGVFLQAEGGTLLLNNIKDLPMGTQCKLLRVLEEKAIRQVGSDRAIPVDVRIIVSSKQNLMEAVERGQFQEELYYKLCVTKIELPSLRERAADIPLLVAHIQRVICTERRLPSIELLHKDWQLLQHYCWPGNIRELENVIEQSVMLGKFDADSLQSSTIGSEELGFPLDWTVEAVERAHIEAVLASVKNNKSAAARVLGVSRKTLERKQQLWQSIENNQLLTEN